MYLRWANTMGFGVKTLDRAAGEEAGANFQYVHAGCKVKYNFIKFLLYGYYS
jgi:protein subunit release factor B